MLGSVYPDFVSDCDMVLSNHMDNQNQNQLRTQDCVLRVKISTILATCGRSPRGDSPVLIGLDAQSAHFYLPCGAKLLQRSALPTSGPLAQSAAPPLRGLRFTLSSSAFNLSMLPHACARAHLLSAFGYRLTAILAQGEPRLLGGGLCPIIGNRALGRTQRVRVFIRWVSVMPTMGMAGLWAGACPPVSVASPDVATNAPRWLGWGVIGIEQQL
jgi:hypothetical protein